MTRYVSLIVAIVLIAGWILAVGLDPLYVAIAVAVGVAAGLFAARPRRDTS